MRLKLEIRESKREPWRPPIELDGRNPRKCITTSAKALVRATILLEAQDNRCEFYLQLGRNPDVRAYVDTHGVSSNGQFSVVDPETQLPSHEFHLFRGGMGTSFLYLIEGTQSIQFRRLAEVVVVLAEDDIRGGYYDKMVSALLDQHLPHYVLDDFKWQMARNLFSIKWNDGYTSTENPDVMLTAISKVVQKMERPVDDICQRPQMMFVHDRRRVFISKISHIDARMIRDVKSTLLRRSANNIFQIAEESIFERRNTATNGTKAHSVVFTFLSEFLLCRLKTIEKSLLERKQETEKELNSLSAQGRPNGRLTIAKQMVVDQSGVLDGLKKKLDKLGIIVRKVKRMMSVPVFANCKPGLTVFDVDPEDFSSSPAYRELYHLMLEYCRSRFWWVGDDSNSFWRMPSIVLSDDGESRLQLKYSIVYENWCFSRLVLALQSLGYECMDHSPKCGDTTCITFQNNENEVKLIHGVIALKRKKGSGTEFECKNASRKTPDFAIVVKDLRNGKSEWIVADAKSDEKLKKHMVQKRQEYAELQRARQEPLASILFRSGEADADFAELEFPPPPLVNVQSDHETNKEPDDNSDDDYKWTPKIGIVEGAIEPPYHGHVRVNIDSFSKRPTIFEEFMEGMIATAIRRMSES